MPLRALPGLIAVLAAGPALAWSLAPASASFTSAGRMKVSSGALGADCAVRFAGTTDAAGHGRITLARFSGGILGACGGIRAFGLPWMMTAAGLGRASIASLRVHTAFSGDCSATNVPVTVTSAGAILFGHVPMIPHCALDGGSVITKPVLRVVP